MENQQPLEGQSPQRHEASKSSSMPKSAMGITALVLGIVALLTSFLPIINNFSALLAVLGVVFSIVGLVGCVRGKRSGKGIAIASLVVSVVAFIVVIASQSMYSAALDSALNGPSATGTTVPSASQSADVASDDAKSQAGSGQAAPEAADTQSLSVGTAATLSDGLVVSVDAVQTGLENYDGSSATRITVTYTNTGTKQATFNPLDWKCEDSQGAQTRYDFYSGAENELSSGTLAAGGTVTGNIYFDGTPAKALYFATAFADGPAAGWLLS